MKVPAKGVAEAATATPEPAELPVAQAAARTPAPSALQIALNEVRRQLAAWMRYEPGARLGEDAEQLHQLRVAVRRIEATLGLFRHQVSPRLLHQRKGAKSVLRILGAARDFDVQLAELDRYCDDLPQPERAASAALRARLEFERSRARSRMIRALDTEATRHWLETLSLASADFSAAAEPGAVPAALVIPERIGARFRKLRKRVRRLGPGSTMEEFHAVRRRAKQLRYALECSAGLLGKPADEVLKSLRRLQDRLGAKQDAYMAKLRLMAIVADPATRLPADTLFFMGRFAEHQVLATAQARKTLRRSWRKVAGKRWNALRAKMEELRASAPLSAAVTLQETVQASASAPVAGPEFAAATDSRPLKH